MTTYPTGSNSTPSSPCFQLRDTFWLPYQERLLTTTLPRQLAILQERGRVENFRRAAQRSGDPSQGIYSFDDTDVYKWLEATSTCLLTHASHSQATMLAEQVERVIELIRAAQEPDGYLNTYYTGARQEQRWQSMDSHELYTAGHLIQAALAHHRATGSEDLLEVAVRFADLLVAKGTDFVDSHPLIELALAELAKATGNPAYLELAQAHLDARGYGRFGKPYRYFPPEYAQDHLPFRELKHAVGHAVRMVYLAAGATEIVSQTGEAALRDALCQQWESLCFARSYVTGGIGARHDGEAFGADYELPSLGAYAETCAAIGSIYWSEKLLALTGEVRYAELLERTLYNAALAGISREGDRYFYVNPLASEGAHRRQEWFDCACCPPNIARLLAQVPRLVAQQPNTDTLRLTLWVAGAGHVTLANGEEVRWSVATEMPWDGEITVTLDQVPRSLLTLELRIPGWTEAPCVTVADEAPLYPQPGSYLRLERHWEAGQQISLSLPMPILRLVAHPRVVDAAGRVALQRGPLIYCIEGVDHPHIDLHALRLRPENILMPHFRPELLGGIVTLEGQAELESMQPWEGALYTSTPPSHTQALHRTSLVAIPYFAWANRDPSAMLVWIPV